LYEKLEQVFDKFPNQHIKILLDFNAKVVEKTFSNQQLGMGVCMKLGMIMALE
jgi:hypothetical protein